MTRSSGVRLPCGSEIAFCTKRRSTSRPPPMPQAAPSTKTSPSSATAFQRERLGDGVDSFMMKSDALDDRTLQLPEESEFVHDVETVAAGEKGSHGQNGESSLKPALAEESQQIVKEARFDLQGLHGPDLRTHGCTHIDVRRRSGIAGGCGEALPRFLRFR